MEAVGLQQALLERMGTGLLIWRVSEHEPRQVRLVAANAAAGRIAQLDFMRCLGRDLNECFPAALGQGRQDVYADVACSGRERALSAGTFAELGPSSVLGRMVPLPERHVAVLFEEATSRPLIEDETSKLNVFLDSIIDNIPAMVFVKDAEHLRYELFNRAGEAMSGFKRADIYGKSARDLFPATQAEFFLGKDRAVLADGRMLDIPEEPIDTPLGKRWLHTKKIPILKPDGTPGHLLGISLDITERKLALEALERAHAELEMHVEERTRELRLANEQLQREMDERQRTQEALARAEQQLRHAQKMEAVGRLAGGIAHDFNNLLSVIMSYAGMLGGSSAGEVPLEEGLLEITRASERAAALTRQLLAFSRQQVLAPRVIDLNQLLQGMSAMLRRLIAEDVRLCIVPGSELGRTRADVGQVEQVIMNLVVNARDAMPSGGTLSIETGNAVLDEAAARELEIAPGPYVTITVTDDGVGMDQATLARVFEPFFTTKEHGKGTGLGLSTVFGIVKQTGGHITVTSEPGKGASFRSYFARTEAPLSELPQRDEPERAARGSETLLLVEDDDQLRAVTREVLKSLGYSVLDAASPHQALAVCAGFAGDIQLLVTDVVMPGMNGRLLAEALLRSRPALRVLFVSGYADSALDSLGELAAPAAFLQKPITPDALASTVRRVLDQKPKRA